MQYKDGSVIVHDSLFRRFDVSRSYKWLSYIVGENGEVYHNEGDVVKWLPYKAVAVKVNQRDSTLIVLCEDGRQYSFRPHDDLPLSDFYFESTSKSKYSLLSSSFSTKLLHPRDSD